MFAGCLAQLLSENSTGSTKTELDLELQNFIMSPYPEATAPLPSHGLCCIFRRLWGLFLYCSDTRSSSHGPKAALQC